MSLNQSFISDFSEYYRWSQSLFQLRLLFAFRLHLRIKFDFLTFIDRVMKLVGGAKILVEF